MGIAQANATPITFPPGSNQTEIEVPITSDTLAEETERFLGRIISGGGIANLSITAPTATVDIRDDDGKLLFPTSSPSHLIAITGAFSFLSKKKLGLGKGFIGRSD